MATLSGGEKSNRLLQVVVGRRRRSARVGVMSDAEAGVLQERAAFLESVANRKCRLDREHAEWVEKLGDRLHAKLSRVLPEVVPPRASAPPSKAVATVGGFLREYLAKRAGVVKGGTMTFYGHTQRNLIDHLGENTPLSDVTEGNAEDFRLYLVREGLATPTVVRRCCLAKTFFKAAVKRRLIDRNPFDEFKGTVRGNRDKFRFVTRDETQKLIDACPDGDWRLLIALARFGGLRTPSESLSLRWEDVNWERNRMTVRSPKTEHHEGKATRVVPIFPELLPFLLEAAERAERGETHVITRYREADYKGPTGWKGCNLGTQFLKIIKRAGLKPWPKPWHNLRATRQTELTATFPVHVVCEWLGNGKLIAQEHYLRTTDADFDRAASTPTGVMQILMQNCITPSGMERNSRPEKRKNPRKSAISGGSEWAILDSNQ